MEATRRAGDGATDATANRPTDRIVAELLAAEGLGLDYASIRLERTPRSWLAVGAELRDRVAERLGTSAVSVEAIGSSSVMGILAKPIIDLAVGYAESVDLSRLHTCLEADGWIYRGDAGDDGGLIFVLEAAPWFRVAHLHGVQFAGPQWQNYLRLRNALRTSAGARERYENEKLRLIAASPDDRNAYTEGKTSIVRTLLSERT